MSESVIERLRSAARKTTGIVTVYPGDVIEEFDAQTSVVRIAALEEAAQIASKFSDMAERIDDSGKSAAFILGCQYAAEKISGYIRALNSGGVGLHASQQPHAADLLPSVANG